MSERDAHPDEGTIHAWLDRQLDDTSSATLEAHLQRCDECAERVAEARGLIAGTSRVLSSLDFDESRASDKPSAEPWRPVVVAAAARRAVPFFRLTPARSAIAAVLVVAVATAIVREHERSTSTPASSASESAVAATAPAAVPAAPAVAQLDTTAGTRVAAGRTFAKAQRETTVNADLARVGAVPTPMSTSPAQQTIAAAKVADSMTGASNRVELRGAVPGAPGAPGAGSGAASGLAGGIARVAAPTPARAPTPIGVEEPQCYRVESATGAAATWGPVALPFVLALDAPATSSAARVLTPAGQDAEARAVFQRRSGDSLLFTLRRIGYTGTLAVGTPGEVRAGVMRSAPSAMLLESTVVTAAPGASERRALRKPSAAQARADSAAAPPERDASPAVPVVVRKVGCH